MKKNLSCIGVVMLLTVSLNAQSPKQKVAGEIYYNVSHLLDTVTNRWMKEVCVLYFTKTSSLYRSSDALNGMAALAKWRANGSVGPNPGISRGSRDLYYTFTDINQVQRVRDFSPDNNPENRKNYVMPEAIDNFQWKIYGETKKIGNCNCQKAIGVCRGRRYEAWFCNDIPFSFGPWKLSGLPGLIMEATDLKNQVSFKFNRIELSNKTLDAIEPIANKIITTEKEFERMRDAYYDSPAGNGLSATITDGQGKAVTVKRPTFNNPMDQISKLPKAF